ncbi:DUF4336 domain-containing protein [Nannocystis punicea]|uniref:DUF4336 domain-containing protein n=1 Tax=Nannocystis punicea TaxID=2995304 RepID=A0ABY7H3A9_9BACT|nr:DUF4336 domain-containing protein [Nannocystis poenicansa]WAS93602.1 DUF4336 domain-containing protein [Nannocystis poenicansa]
MLQSIDTNLWTATQPFRMLGLQIGARTTVVRLGSGGLLVHAPIQPTPELRAAIDTLGSVQAVVAPNSMHHLYLGPFLAAYPQARGYAAAGAIAKHPELQLENIPKNPDLLWAGDLDHFELEGAPGLGEVAFFHRASRTLILTDWMFYFERSPNWLTGLYLRLAGALGKPVQTPVLKKLVKDRAAARAARERLLAWDFDRVVMSHRDILPTGGKEALRAATAWL